MNPEEKPISKPKDKTYVKYEALEKILENWRTGMSEPYAPAAGSADELRLKLAVRKG